MDAAPSPQPQRIPELLAPAGNWECARAAVANGADAIYFGLDRFNARLRADNFTLADLPEVARYLHRHGVKGYVTFNTLVFSDELEEAQARLRAIIESGIDAIIVQDLGLCRLIRSLSPDFPIHASTQMTITSAAGVRLAGELGAHLVVLARECSIKEITEIRKTLREDTATEIEMPLEVFVHGALCVAYSGQCLTSEALGGRSANRGECAQACRMPYELIADGQTVDLGDRRYLLSPQDLSGLELLPQLAEAGVASLKIEGRLKAPEYVASVTRTYRQALDSLEKQRFGLRDDARYELEMAFSRGLYTGWLGGIDNQKLAHARYAKKRGAFLGTIQGLKRDGFQLRVAREVRPGDGVVVDPGRGPEAEQGGRVYSVEGTGVSVTLGFQRGALDTRKLNPGDPVWKTDDPQLNKELKRTFSNPEATHARPLHFRVKGALDTPLEIEARDTEGRLAQAASSIPLVTAQNRPLTEEALRKQLGRLGSEPFYLATLETEIDGALMLPISELNRLRRELVDQLRHQRESGTQWTLHDGSALERLRQEQAGNTTTDVDGPQLIAMLRRTDQIDAALNSGVRSVYLEFENPKTYRDAVARCRAWEDRHGQKLEVFIAPPRVWKPGEDWILKQTRSSAPDGYLVRNADHLEAFQGERRRGDFSLNVANDLTASWFLNHAGLESVTASYDLNIQQLQGLISRVDPRRLDITLHQRMPMFHMEHCVFCAFLSKGKDYRDCGRPCEKKTVHLRDRAGVDHPLVADAGCRNTLYNGRAQSGVEFAPELLAWGIRRFRIDFLSESPEEVQSVLENYRDVLSGTKTPEMVWRTLKLTPKLGVTRGQLDGAVAHRADQ